MCCPCLIIGKILEKFSIFKIDFHKFFFVNSRSRPTLSRHAKVLAIRRILTITKKSLFASHPPKNARKNSRTFKIRYKKKIPSKSKKNIKPKKNCRTYNSVKQMKFAKKNPLVAVQKTIFGYECKTNKKNFFLPLDVRLNVQCFSMI